VNVKFLSSLELFCFSIFECQRKNINTYNYNFAHSMHVYQKTRPLTQNLIFAGGLGVACWIIACNTAISKFTCLWTLGQTADGKQAFVTERQPLDIPLDWVCSVCVFLCVLVVFYIFTVCSDRYVLIYAIQQIMNLGILIHQSTISANAWGNYVERPIKHMLD
jgi:hypothetical protein